MTTIQNAMVQEVRVSIVVDHCKGVGDACDAVREIVADEVSKAMGIKVAKGFPILEDWECDGPCGDKIYNLHFKFNRLQLLGR